MEDVADEEVAGEGDVDVVGEEVVEGDVGDTTTTTIGAKVEGVDITGVVLVAHLEHKTTGGKIRRHRRQLIRIIGN